MNAFCGWKSFLQAWGLKGGYGTGYRRKAVNDMSTVQSQVVQSLDGLSDEDLSFILDMIKRFMKPVEAGEKAAADGKKSAESAAWKVRI